MDFKLVFELTFNWLSNWFKLIDLNQLIRLLFLNSTGELKNLIKTPLLDKAYTLDLSPEFIFETLKYFIDCGERLTQMTKTYDDIDAVTRLLEEVGLSLDTFWLSFPVRMVFVEFFIASVCGCRIG